MNLKFKDWKGIEIVNICRKNLLNQIKSLPNEEGNYQVVERTDGLVVQWINLGEGILRVEKVVSSDKIYFINLKKDFMDSLVNLLFMDSDLKSLPWRKIKCVN